MRLRGLGFLGVGERQKKVEGGTLLIFQTLGSVLGTPGPVF